MITRQLLPKKESFFLPSGKFSTQRHWHRNICAGLAVVALFCSIPLASARAADLLFKSNFGPGVVLEPPSSFYTNGAWQKLSGTDKETGYSWPVSALGSSLSAVQLITVDPITPDTIGNYITNEIRPVTGPDGTTVNELFQQVKIKAPVGDGGSQAPLMIQRPWTIGDVNELYISYWFKHQPDLESRLDNTVPAGHWRVQFEFKTGGYLNNWHGDYRIVTNIFKGVDGKLYWYTAGDNVANGPWSKVVYWREENHTVPVPIDKWFKYEIYWRRSAGADGRFWSAVDGQVIVDHRGPNMGDENLPITRIMVNNAYSGGYPNVESRTTGLEIWNGFPCGDGVPCYNSGSSDTVAPTAPSSLTASLQPQKGKRKSSSAKTLLFWGASTDNVGVSGYYIYRNGIKIGTSSATSYTDVLSTASGTTYAYKVEAFDAKGNTSASSNEARVTY